MQNTEQSNLQLQQGENLLYVGKLHWIVFTNAMVWVFVSIYLFLRVPEWSFFAYFALLFAGVSWIYALLNYTMTSFNVTNQRIIVKQGVLQQQYSQLLLSRVTNVEITRSLLGRLFGYGSVMVHGFGGSINGLDRMVNPEIFVNHLQPEIDKLVQQRQQQQQQQ